MKESVAALQDDVAEECKATSGNMAGAQKGQASSRVRSLAFCGLTIAILTVSAWVTVPFGPVPFTLQTFAIMFAVLVLTPKEAIASVAGYLALGTIGLPIFSSMRGGIGVIVGPTGGFLWGFLAGTIVAALFVRALRGMSSRSRGAEVAVYAVAAVLFTALTYAIGWAQMVLISGMAPDQAFAVGVAPFLVIDACKMVAAVAVAMAVKKALRR